MPHVRLRDEAAVAGRVHDDDIEPRDVVRDEKDRPARGRRAADLERDAETLEQVLRPPFDALLALRRGEARKGERDLRQPTDDSRENAAAFPGCVKPAEGQWPR